jgi:hypothetical protein
VQDTFFAASGFVDPQHLSPSSDSLFDLDLLDDDDDSPGPASSDAHLLHSVHSTALPDSDMAFLDAYIDTLDPGSRALYALDFKVREMKIPRSLVYQQLRAEEASLGPSAPARAHMDGGAMASTTDRLDYLWHVTSFDPSHRTPVLRVADDRDHTPIAVGYLRIPTQDSVGFRMTQCYYTPSIPATIVSPDAMGKQFACTGYTSVSQFYGGPCSVRLHHCKRVSEDATIPLLPIRGLLYTDPLIPPSTDTDRHGPPPSPVLHVKRLEQSVPPPSVERPPPAHPSAMPCPCHSSSPHGFGEGPSLVFSPPVTSGCAPSASIAEKVLFFQRLGYQSDVSLADLHSHASGVPAWSTSLPPICGHCSPCPDSSSTAPVAQDPSSSTSASASDDPVAPAPSPSLEELMFAPADDSTYLLRHLTRDQLRILWHQRLGHLHSRRVSDLHRFAQGVPSVPIATELDTCPICAQAKLRKAARGVESS